MKNLDILEELADKLLELPEEKFYMGVFREKASSCNVGKGGCGTVGCALGWLPNLSRKAKKLGFHYSKEDHSIIYTNPANGHSYAEFDAAREFFDLPNGIEYKLFCPSKYAKGARTSRQQVSRKIKKFLESVELGFVEGSPT